MPGRRIRVLIVDDSAIVRRILTEALSAEPDLEVVGTAPDPYVARDKILALNPDVLTLDIEMPRMDGLTFLKKLMHFHPIPTIVISSLAQSSCSAALSALELGAVEVMGKPGGPCSVGGLGQMLAHKVRAAAAAKFVQVSRLPIGERAAKVVRAAGTGVAAAGGKKEARAPAFVGGVRVQSGLETAPAAATLGPEIDAGTVLAIGASTGGTEAIATLLTKMPAGCPAVVVAQHIPAHFSHEFAKRLNGICAMEVKEAEDGDVVRSGLVLVAPGDFHMLLRGSVGKYFLSVKAGPRVCYQRPSVDVLFASVAEAAKARAVGVLLTGMGTDGAQGLLKMSRAGAHTIAQDEETCVVYGMPREAVALGAAAQVLPLGEIAAAMLEATAETGSQRPGDVELRAGKLTVGAW